jgi:hypothetical protein
MNYAELTQTLAKAFTKADERIRGMKLEIVGYNNEGKLISIKYPEKKEYPWEQVPAAVNKEPDPEEAKLKKMIRSERKKLRKLKHAGVL